MAKKVNSAKSEQGRKNRSQGKLFEKKVREDLEKTGWIVSKWSNNIEFGYFDNDMYGKFRFIAKPWDELKLANGNDYPGKPARLIPAKSQFNPFFKRIVGEGSGFPDFIAYRIEKTIQEWPCKIIEGPIIIGVEAKINGRLDAIEKEKCEWLLANNIFNKIFIASKGLKRGSVHYEEYVRIVK